MGGYLKRREVIALLGGAAAILRSLPAISQSPAKRAVIGLLLLGSKTATEPRRSGFPQGMQEFGYVQGRDYIIEDRYADGALARLPTLFQELVRIKSDVIVTGTTVGILDVTRTTGTIPIVGVSLTDPVGFGLAASLARPGAQVTGILIISDGFARKQVELALEVVPGATKIGMLVNVSNQSNAVHRRNIEVATGALALKLVAGEAHGPDDLDAAFQTLVREHVRVGGRAPGWIVCQRAPTDCDAGGCSAAARALPLPRVSRRRWSDELRRQSARELAPGGDLRGQDPEGCQAGRPADRAADERTGDQRENRQGAGPHSSTIATGARRRGDRVSVADAAYGTFRNCRASLTSRLSRPHNPRFFFRRR